MVLMRHGQSDWNLQNRFTGWVDVPLTATGEQEALAAGKALKAHKLSFDVAFTSVLSRAVKTLNIVLEETNQLWLPVIKDYRLNERHYGGLTGLDKAETAREHGEEMVMLWRRSYDVPPPLMLPSSPFWLASDRRYAGVPAASIPATESLKTTGDRVLPYWLSDIAPLVRAGQRVVIAAHGNSLRALIKHIDGISDEAIVKLNIPTAVPLVYELDDSLKPIPPAADVRSPGLNARYL